MLLNRRGWSNFLSCRACGRVWLCPNCDVALVLHRHGGFVACHHCGHRELVPERCPSCASVSLARHGAGTERIEHELREALVWLTRKNERARRQKAIDPPRATKA